MSDTRLATLDHDSKSSTLQTTITAVDVVLEPDVTMIRQAQAANAALLKNFPKGYALGDEHAPHISVMGAMSTQQVWTSCSRRRRQCWPARR